MRKDGDTETKEEEEVREGNVVNFPGVKEFFWELSVAWIRTKAIVTENR